MSWQRSSRRDPCSLCGDDGAWCSRSADGAVIKCRHVEDGAFKTGDDGGGVYYLHWADGKPRAAYVHTPDPAPTCAPAVERDRAYRALLSVLSLSTEHAAALARRGLTSADVARNLYRTLPPAGDRRAVVKALRAALGGTITNDIPGFDYAADGVRLLGPAGLMIPVRDATGLIVAIKLRPDNPSGGKYIWLSSSGGDREGPSAGAPVQVSAASDAARVRVTEGPLKADVAAALSGVTTLGVSGATAWRSAVPALKTLGARTVVLAWDADARKPPKPREDGGKTFPSSVAGGLEMAALGLTAEGLAIELETWPCDTEFEPKGIDDALRAGADVVAHAGVAAWRELVAILKASGREPKAETVRRAAEGGNAPANDLTDLPTRTQTDPAAPLLPGVPSAIARLKATDPAAYARLLVELKRAGAPMGLVNAAVRDAEKTIKRASMPTPTGRTFQRGDGVELAAALLEDLRAGSPESIVYDRGQLWRYDADTGVFAVVPHQDAFRVASNYAGCYAGAGERAKPIKLSTRDIDGAIRAASQFASHPGFFDAAPPGVAFTNGFVTVTPSGEIQTLPLSPTHRATHVLPVAYEPSQPRARWLTMLGEVFRRTEGDLPGVEGDQRLRDTDACVALLQEFAGASLLGFATSFATCVVLVGAGNDGKSKTLSVLRALFPASSVCSVPPQNWSRGFLLAELSGKRLNVVSELPEREIEESQRFKSVVAGDALTAERKYADPFSLVCGAGHLFAANALPATRDQSIGFWRRFAVIPCTRRFTGAEEVRDYDRIVIAEELAGVAAWAIEGAARLRQQGAYTSPESSQRAKAEWQMDSDQVRQFVEDCCDVTDVGCANIGQLYDAFVAWGRATGHAGLSRNKLGSRLRALGHDGRTTLARLYRLQIKRGPTSEPMPDVSWSAPSFMDA